MSVDSLRKVNDTMKSTLDYLLLMPNDNNLKKAAKLVLETTQKDSVLIQVWEPKVNANDGSYTRVLVNELNLKN